MPTSLLPPNQCRVTYILLRTAKRSLEAAAKVRRVSMSQVITDALERAGVFRSEAPTKARRAKKAA